MTTKPSANYLTRWWNALLFPEQAARLVVGRDRAMSFTFFLAAFESVLYAGYGFTMGFFRGGFPAAVSGLKLPFLFLFTVVVCYPSLYVLNCVFGPRLTAGGCIRLLLLAVSANAIALGSYAPFSFFFTTTTSKAGYGFLLLMHVAVFALAGVASLLVAIRIFRATAIAQQRPARAFVILLWGALYGFVGMQMAWILRPWIGSWSQAYTPFRPLSGSIFESVWHLIKQAL